MSEETIKITEKIEKLLAKANRAGTPEEADAFFAKAQEMMTKWAIDEAMLNSVRQADREEVGTEVFIIKRSGYHNSMVQLFAEVASANNVKVLVRSPAHWKEEAGVVAVGFPSDISRTVMMYTSLLIQVTRERGRQCPLYVKAEGGAAVARWRTSFSFGFAARIGERLREQRDLATKQATQDSEGTGMALVLLDRSDEVARLAAALSGGKARRGTRKDDGEGRAAGHRSADRADIGNKGVRGAGPAALG